MTIFAHNFLLFNIVNPPSIPGVLLNTNSQFYRVFYLENFRIIISLAFRSIRETFMPHDIVAYIKKLSRPNRNLIRRVCYFLTPNMTQPFRFTKLNL